MEKIGVRGGGFIGLRMDVCLLRSIREKAIATAIMIDTLCPFRFMSLVDLRTVTRASRTKRCERTFGQAAEVFGVSLSLAGQSEGNKGCQTKS